MPFRPYLQEPEWTWLIVIEMTLAGLAAGSYLAYALMTALGRAQDRRIAQRLGFLPLPLLLIVAFILIVDLGQPLRFLNLVFTSPSAVPERGGPFMLNVLSPLSFGTYIITAFGLFTLVAFVDSLAHSGRISTMRLGEILAHNPVWLAIGSLLAVFAASYSGMILNVTQQTVWTDSVLVAALYLGFGFFSGLGAAAILTDRAAAGASGALRDTLLWVAIVNVVLLVLFVATLVPNGYWQAVALSLRTAPVFWLGLVGAGLVAPIVLLTARRPAPGRLAIVGWLTLVGALSLRYTVLFAAISALHG